MREERARHGCSHLSLHIQASSPLRQRQIADEQLLNSNFPELFSSQKRKKPFVSTSGKYQVYLVAKQVQTLQKKLKKKNLRQKKKGLLDPKVCQSGAET